MITAKTCMVQPQEIYDGKLKKSQDTSFDWMITAAIFYFLHSTHTHTLA